MKKVIRITEAGLHKVIDKVLKEQEDQYMTGVDQEKMAGDAQTDPATPSEEGPNFEEFLAMASNLLDQGSTIGQLVDKLIEKQNGGTEEGEENPESGNPEGDEAGAQPIKDTSSGLSA